MLTARLGVWQLDRAAQKDALQAEVQARSLLPPVTLPDLASGQQEAAAQHHRLASLRGHWMPETTVFLDNRPMGGRAGFFVLTPLKLEDGTAVLVQRGWQPRDVRDRTLTQPVPGSADQAVQVRGRLAPPPSRLLEFEPSSGGPIRQNLELDAYAAEIRQRLRPVLMVQLEPALLCAPPPSDGAACSEVLADGLLREWTMFGSTADKNRGYAAQWFSLSALVLGLYVWFQWIKPWRTRRKGHTA